MKKIIYLTCGILMMVSLFAFSGVMMNNSEVLASSPAESGDFKPGGPKTIDTAAAAEELEVTEESLINALGDPKQGPPDFSAEENLDKTNIEGSLNGITISEIKIEGNSKIQTQKIKELLNIKTAEVLNINELDEGLDNINRYYEDQGYLFSGVVDVKVKDNNQLYIVIEEARLNNIEITGNEDTKEFVIRKNISIKKGDILNIKKIKSDLKKISELGYFKEITPEFERVESDKHKINLSFNIKEKKTGKFNIGGGYSSDDGLALLLGISKDNLFGEAKKLSLDIYTGDEERYEINYNNPWFLNSETSIDYEIYKIEDEDSNDNEEDDKGTNLTFGHQLGKNVKGYLTLAYEDSEYYEEEEDDSDEYYKVNENTRSITAASIRDTRDSILNPRKGSWQKLSVEEAGFGGDSDFTKYQLELRKYLPSGEDNSWAFRLKVGASSGELSSDNLYSLSTYKLRGYNDDYYDDDNDPEENGFEGESILSANLEYRIGITDSITGIAFFDAGRTFSDNEFELDDLHYTAGLGARITTPIGKLGLDYGYAPEGSLDKSDFLFQISNSF